MRAFEEKKKTYNTNNTNTKIQTRMRDQQMAIYKTTNTEEHPKKLVCSHIILMMCKI